MNNGVLTIDRERSEERKTKEARYYASECFTGSFTRSFTLPDGVDAEATTANYSDGLLEVCVPLRRPRG